jgi:hypothetical protein
MAVPALEPGCPWSELSALAPPNVKWCEEQICGWIVEPANTWSNLGYILIGLVLIVRAWKPRNRMMFTFGWAELIVGVFSFTYHMSYTFALQVLDFAAMYVFMGLLVALNLQRLGVFGRRGRGLFYGALLAGMTALTILLYFVGFPIQALVLVLVLVTLATEAMIRLRRLERPEYRWFWTALGLITVAMTFSALDHERIFCDPKDHLIQGHAIWHMLGAVSLYASYLFYRQFAAKLTTDPA